jgi:hypothetical protein
VYLGNAKARRPSYDFAQAATSEATLGIAEANAELRTPQAPFSERKPWVLNAILGIAVAVMVFITYRFARKA